MHWHAATTPIDRLVVRLVRAQRIPVLGSLIRVLLILRGTEIPKNVELGDGFRLKHGGTGVVMHYYTQVGRNVTVYQHVTFGRADVWRPAAGPFDFDIGDEAIIAAGACILARKGTRTIGTGAVIGANSVVTEDVGPWEIWAGVPARCVGKRDFEAA